MFYHAHQYQLMVQQQHVVQQIIVILAIYYRKQQRQPHQRTVHQIIFSSKAVITFILVCAMKIYRLL
jgi:hypothetical protein